MANTSSQDEPPDPEPQQQQSDGSPPTDPEPEPDGSDSTAKKARMRRGRVSAAEKQLQAIITEANQIRQEKFSVELIKQVLWSPDWDASLQSSASLSHEDITSLPPPQVLEDVYNKLLIALHPHSQDQACAPNSEDVSRMAMGRSDLVEPSLGLYCPIEGGNFVIDATVKELARRTGSEVVMIDAAQLAAGEHGIFGKAAAVFKDSPNPLHLSPQDAADFTSSNPDSSPHSNEEENTDGPTFQIMTLPMHADMIGPGTAVMRPSRSTPMSKEGIARLKMRHFFDGLIRWSTNLGNATSPDEPVLSTRPRIVYLRDFDYLVSSAGKWFPHLLESVRAWRQGGDESTGRMVNAITIVLGVTPEIRRFPPRPQAGSVHEAVRAIPAKKPTEATAVAVGKKWPEDIPSDEDNGAKRRESDLKSWLSRWELEGDGAVQDELPWTLGKSDDSPSSNPLGRRIGLMEQLKAYLPGLASQNLPVRIRLGGGQDEHEKNGDFGYFRVAGVVPALRDVTRESSERMQRRKELNTLAFETILGAIGGFLASPLLRLSPPRPVSQESLEDGTAAELESDHDFKSRCVEDAAAAKKNVFVEWERSLVDKDVLGDVAMRAMSLAIAQKRALDPLSSHEQMTASETSRETVITWGDVEVAWDKRKLDGEERKAWFAKLRQLQRPSSAHYVDLPPSIDVGESDEVINKVKADKSLDTHEKRLLGCIVDTATMPTTFASVHLPVKTIDAVRTMVSLPLLYPEAFQEGILKTHSMTGALLLGPPGVGKTLLARAVARESGARMLVVKPSDVMDMYVGEGEKLVRSVFSLARRLSPCVIFLDELDALFASRVSSRESGGAMAHRSVITEFMQEMDGLKTDRSQGNVIVIGATNRPFDLDDAVLRRLPRRLLVDLPGEKERLEILKIMLKDETLSPDVDMGALAKRTEMFSGSDLKHVCVSVALDAIKEGVDLPWATAAKALHASNGSTTTAPVSEPSTSTGTHTETPIAPLDAVTPDEDAHHSNSSADDNNAEALPLLPRAARVLHGRHFDKALQEIVPSTSETLGTLSELRKWNEEFGEGRASSKGKKQRWGGGKFGFGGKDGKDADGRVMPLEERTAVP